MNRLPTLDRATQQGELVSMASLALAGVAIIVMAGAQMTRFAVGREGLAEALTAPNAVTATAGSGPEKMPLATNSPQSRPLLSATQVRPVPQFPRNHSPESPRGG